MPTLDPNPYGVNYYMGNRTPIPLVDSKMESEMTGSTGLVPGGPMWLRPQAQWGLIESTHTTPPTYDFTAIDNIVQRCNAANIYVIFNIFFPPTWRMSIDINGNTVPSDGTTCVTYLTVPITATGVATGSITVHALTTGQTLVNGQQITLDYTNGQIDESCLVSGNYSAGATVITVTSLNGGQWKPRFTHTAGTGTVVENSGAVFSSGADATHYTKTLAARYNGTTVNAITGAAQTAQTITAIQWNEDYDLKGSNAQRTASTKWYVGMHQVCGPLIRQYAPKMLIGGPAARRSIDDGTSAPYGLAHITQWQDHIFSYKPVGSSITGAAQWLDFLDFHYYRDGVSNADPNVPLPDASGSAVPTPAQEITAIKAVAANYGYTDFDVWCTETGWATYDDGSGTQPTVTQAQQKTYNHETFDQHQTSGGSHVILWVMDTSSIAKLWTIPPGGSTAVPSATQVRSIVQNVQTVQGGATTYTRLPSFTDLKNYAKSNPTWSALTQYAYDARAKFKVNATVKAFNTMMKAKFKTKAKLQAQSRSKFKIHNSFSRLIASAQATFQVRQQLQTSSVGYFLTKVYLPGLYVRLKAYTRSGKGLFTTTRTGKTTTTTRGS